MQKRLIFPMFALICSCTVVHKRPPNKYSLELFDPISKDEKYFQNKLVEMRFISCRKRWFSDGGKSKEFLRKEFKNKYGVELYGISNMEIEMTHVVDSSVFIPNEICHRVVGNPVTRNKLNVVDKEEWEVVNPAHHIH